jgi:hypothetical protein
MKAVASDLILQLPVVHSMTGDERRIAVVIRAQSVYPSRSLSGTIASVEKQISSLAGPSSSSDHHQGLLDSERAFTLVSIVRIQEACSISKGWQYGDFRIGDAIIGPDR